MRVEDEAQAIFDVLEDNLSTYGDGTYMPSWQVADEAGLTDGQFQSGWDLLRRAVAKVDGWSCISQKGPYGGIAVTRDPTLGKAHNARVAAEIKTRIVMQDSASVQGWKANAKGGQRAQVAKAEQHWADAADSVDHMVNSTT